MVIGELEHVSQVCNPVRSGRTRAASGKVTRHLVVKSFDQIKPIELRCAQLARRNHFLDLFGIGGRASFIEKDVQVPGRLVRCKRDARKAQVWNSASLGHLW